MNHLICLTLIIITTSCSSINKIAINSSTSVLKDGGESLYHESNFEVFEKSSFANIKTMETLYHFNKDNMLMNELLIKSYGAIGFGLYETKLLEASLSGSDSLDEIKFDIKQMYSRAIWYGEEYISKKGLTPSKFYKIKNSEEMDKYFDKEDKVALFYFAQSLGGLLNSDLSNMIMIEKAATIKVVIDWVCNEVADDFEYGGCLMFDASYDALRPRMLGGNMQKARYKFQKLMEKYPQNLLVAMGYIQYILIPMLDEAEYKKVMTSFKVAATDWRDSLLYGKQNLSKQSLLFAENKEFNLFNAIAVERMKILTKFENEIF